MKGFPNLLNRIKENSSTVFITEQTRDIDLLFNKGVSVAYLPQDQNDLSAIVDATRERNILIAYRNDEAGKLGSAACAAFFNPSAASVKILDLSAACCDMPHHGDISSIAERYGWNETICLITTLADNTPCFATSENIDEQDETPLRLHIQCASTVPYEPPEWLISPYFPRRKCTLIQGDNGTGKTAFACAVAASVTTGSPLFESPVQTPGNVLMLSVEDDLPVLRGRVEADGGDVRKLYFITEASSLTFIDNELERAIRQLNARFVLFDPLQAFLGADVDMHRANETRPVFARLNEVAARCDCAIGIIAHTAKNSDDRTPVNRALGSVDIAGAMRSIVHVMENPGNDRERIAVQVKSSNAPKGQSLLYQIIDRGAVQWLGYSEITASDLCSIKRRKERENSGIPYGIPARLRNAKQSPSK